MRRIINLIKEQIFWIKNRFRIVAYLQYKEVCRHEKLSVHELEEYEWEKQKSIVEIAYNHSRFYKRFYDGKGFHPSMLRNKADWQKVPVLEKDLVRNYCDEILSDEAIPSIIYESTTGGSTGKPLKVFHDRRFHSEILGWRSFRWWGVSPSASVGIVHRRVPKTKLQKIKKKIIWWPTYRTYLDASFIDDDNISDFIKSIIKHKIVWLQGYVGALEKVADYIIDHDVNIDSLKMVWSTSSPLFEHVRDKMERAFGCKVMNQYGCCEIFHIATQCPQTNQLHIHSDCVHVDVVNSNNEFLIDEEGDILVTDLRNEVFPLIKYRLGDKGTLLSNYCPCGLNLPMMKEVKGRISDAVICPSGHFVDGNYLTTLFDNYYDYIDQFQVRQDKNYNIKLIVKLKHPEEKLSYIILETIRKKFISNVNNEVPVEVQVVDHINDDNGKIRYVISEVVLGRS